MVAILKEFLPEFTTPETAIIREATYTWPAIYKKEYHIPIRKVPSPQTEDDVRQIGLTAWVSKQPMRVVLNWIWPYNIDPDQMDGVPGGSVEHYIINMLNFIWSNMYSNRNIAVLSVTVDYQKALSRMLHSHILCNLAEHSMKLNRRKIKVMSYNNSKTKNFMPQLKLEQDSFLEVIYEIKLVRLVLTSYLKWTSHINYTVMRVNIVIWQRAQAIRGS